MATTNCSNNTNATLSAIPKVWCLNSSPLAVTIQVTYVRFNLINAEAESREDGEQMLSRCVLATLRPCVWFGLTPPVRLCRPAGGTYRRFASTQCTRDGLYWPVFRRSRCVKDSVCLAAQFPRS